MLSSPVQWPFGLPQSLSPIFSHPYVSSIVLNLSVDMFQAASSPVSSQANVTKIITALCLLLGFKCSCIPMIGAWRPGPCHVVFSLLARHCYTPAQQFNHSWLLLFYKLFCWVTIFEGNLLSWAWLDWWLQALKQMPQICQQGQFRSTCPKLGSL